ncbi:MAG: hypothetical protein HRU00_09705 [Myxococcales bacterium]|nr:hypothetical protein [Myxococcales bacterium]
MSPFKEPTEDEINAALDEATEQASAALPDSPPGTGQAHQKSNESITDDAFELTAKAPDAHGIAMAAIFHGVDEQAARPHTRVQRLSDGRTRILGRGQVTITIGGTAYTVPPGATLTVFAPRKP